MNKKLNYFFTFAIVFIFIFSTVVIPKSANVQAIAADNFKLAFKPADIINHPSKPIVYMADTKGKKLYALNYSTGIMSSIQLALPPESLAFANGELYVTLLKMNHDPYKFDGQSGAIGIIDSETFKVKEQIDIDTDPYDIQVDDEGYIYVSPGSGQWAELKVYSRNTKQLISSVGNVYMSTNIYLKPGTKKLYTISTVMSSKYFEVFEMVDNKIQFKYRMDNFSNYNLSPNSRLSPDRQFYF
jgi:hypothetical protein